MPFFSLPSLCICFFCVSRQNQSCVLQSTEKSKFGRKHVKREGSSTRRTDVASAIRTENLLLSFIELPAAMRKMPKQREKKNTKQDEESDPQQSKSSTHRSWRWKSPRHPETGKMQREDNQNKTQPKIQSYTTLLHCLQSSSKRRRDPLFPPPSNPAAFKRKNPDWINIAGAIRKKKKKKENSVRE